MNDPLSTIELFTVVFLAVCVAGIVREIFTDWTLNYSMMSIFVVVALTAVCARLPG